MANGGLAPRPPEPPDGELHRPSAARVVAPPASLTGRVLANVLAATASIAFTTIGVELALGHANRSGSNERVSHPHGEMSTFTRYHPILGWDGAPNRRERLLNQTVTLNSLGNRGPEVPFAKPMGLKRVVVLGDSQAWGLGVADDRTIAAQLEARLNASGSRRWQAINLGVSGFGTDQAFLKYLLQGARYQPDAVVEVVFKNDALENASTQAWRVEKPRFYFDSGRLCLGNLPPPMARGWPENALLSGDGVKLLGRRFDLSWSETYRYFQNRSWRFQSVPKPDPSDMARLRSEVACLANREQYPGDGERILLTLLRRLDALTRSEGSRLLLVFVPRPVDQRRPRRAAYYDAVQAETARSGIVTIDLRRCAYAAGLRTKAMFFRHDSHLTATGSALVAEALAERLR